MQCIECVLKLTSVAVEKDKISKAELVRTLSTLASLLHEYVPERGQEPALIVEMNDEWNERFARLMWGN